MTSQSGLSGGAFAVVIPHFVDAGGAVVARPHGTVVHVFRTVLSRPPVDADALVAAVLVLAGGAVLAGVNPETTFVHIDVAILAFKCRGTGTGIAFNSIDTSGPIFTEVVFAVVNVNLTVLSVETRRTATLVAQWPHHDAGPAILTRRRGTRKIRRLTVFTCIRHWTRASVLSEQILARSSVLARGHGLTFVNVFRAVLASVSGLAVAGVSPVERGASASVTTRLGCAIILSFAD